MIEPNLNDLSEQIRALELAEPPECVWTDDNFDRQYEVLGDSMPEHDPAEGYYIFRGITQKNIGKFIGSYWAQDFAHAYGSSDLGRGDLFVARIDVDEAISLAGEDSGWRLADLAWTNPSTTGFLYVTNNQNPKNARRVTEGEYEKIFDRLPPGFDMNPVRTRVLDWHRLYKDVFASSFE